MLYLLYYICFEHSGYESSDYKPLGLKWLGSKCEKGSKPNWYDAEPPPIGFGTFFHIWNPIIPNPMIRYLLICNLIVQNKYSIINITFNNTYLNKIHLIY